MQKIQYIRALPADVSSVAKLHQLLYSDDPTRTMIGLSEEIRKAVAEQRVWAAKTGERIVSYLIIDFFGPDQKNFPNSIFMSGLYVVEPYRKQGIGRQLVEVMSKEEFPIQFGYFSVTHDPNEKWLTGYYESLGYKKIGTTEAGNIKMTKSRF